MDFLQLSFYLFIAGGLCTISDRDILSRLRQKAIVLMRACMTLFFSFFSWFSSYSRLHLILSFLYKPSKWREINNKFT